MAEAADLQPGVIITVPAPFRGRPYCLQITHIITVSKVTGAVDLMGNVLGLDGTTKRKKRLLRRTVVDPARVTIFSTPDTPEVTR